MPLDPQAEAFLKEMSDSGAKPFESMTPAEARLAVLLFKELGGAPEEVASVEHRFISGPTADLPVWIYRPDGGSAGPLPGLIYFHGSGWVVANIEVSRQLQPVACQPHRMLCRRRELPEGPRAQVSHSVR